MSKSRAYLSYLLRLWCSDENAPWHASLEDARTHEHHAFPEADQLFDYLREQMQPPLSTEESETTHRSQP